MWRGWELMMATSHEMARGTAGMPCVIPMLLAISGSAPWRDTRLPGAHEIRARVRAQDHIAEWTR